MVPQLRDTCLIGETVHIGLPIFEPRLIYVSRPLLLHLVLGPGLPGCALETLAGFLGFPCAHGIPDFHRGCFKPSASLWTKRPGDEFTPPSLWCARARPLWIPSLLTSVGVNASYFQVVVLRVQLTHDPGSDGRPHLVDDPSSIDEGTLTLSICVYICSCEDSTVL